jgi:AcrR family transcriptional regulator
MPKQGKTPKKTATAARTRRVPRGTAPRVADRETEQRILDAARAVFIRRGTAGARMQEIAAEAGVNQALLHYYFRSKERLSAAVFEQFAGRLFPVIVQLLGGDLPLDQKIDRVIATYLENLARNPFLPGYILSELHHHPERVGQLLAAAAQAQPSQVIAPVLQKLGAQIRERVAAGAMRPIAPEQLAINLLSLCVFPFAARPMLSIAFGMDDAAFARFVEQRKTELPAFFHNALRP